MKKTRGRLFVFLMAVVLILGIFFIVRNRNSSTSGSLDGSQSSVGQHLQAKTALNILLLGYGGGNHDGAYLTDSMLVAHVDLANKMVSLLSILRDIWIKIPTNGTDGGYWKINAAYEVGMDDTDYPNKLDRFKGSNGAPNLAKYMVEQVIGVPIDNYVAMDFQGFVEAIDKLGGVDINVQKAFTDSEYPIDGKVGDTCGLSPQDITSRQATMSADTDVFPCRYQTVHFDAGLQHMDGKAALEYVRSRHSAEDGSDFGRAQRQRNLIEAVVKKALSLESLPNLIPFTLTLKDHLATDFTTDDAYAALSQVDSLKQFKMQSYALTDANFLVDGSSADGQAILTPKIGTDDWSEVHSFVAGIFSANATVAAVVQVENGTEIPGLAQLATNRLDSLNIQTLAPKKDGIISGQPTQVIFYAKNINASDLAVIENEFGINEVSYQSSSGGTNNVLVVVGEDYNQKEGKKVLNEP